MLTGADSWGLKPVLLAQNLTFNSDAVLNYKHMFGPHSGSLRNQWNITVKHKLITNTVMKQSDGINCDMKPENMKTTDVYDVPTIYNDYIHSDFIYSTRVVHFSSQVNTQRHNNVSPTSPWRHDLEMFSVAMCLEDSRQIRAESHEWTSENQKRE